MALTRDSVLVHRIHELEQQVLLERDKRIKAEQSAAGLKSALMRARASELRRRAAEHEQQGIKPD
jgi:hypothetical protein